MVMVFLIVICLLSAYAIVFGDGDWSAFGIGVSAVIISIMVCACWQKLKTIEAKLNKMNEKDKSDK